MKKMAVSDSARTHMVYQFIIVTLLFMSVGWNELLPDRKWVLLLASAPLFCYQLVILSCCMELVPVPRWMTFLQRDTRPISAENDFKGTRSSSSESIRTSSPIQSEKSIIFPDATELASPWRRQKSVANLGVATKCYPQSQKSKSWMSLNESKSAEKLLSSREGSLDVLVPLCNRKCTSSILKQVNKTRSREERSKKAKSWKPCEVNFYNSSTAELAKPVSSYTKSSERTSSSSIAESENGELSKSFSFPFRQKRLETWRERNESTVDSNQSLDMPYWHSVGYNLAVKFEARRRQRASDNLDKSETINEESVQMVQKHQETSSDAVPSDRHSSKKCSKLAAARINKLKVGISNLISKKRDEASENGSANSNKVGKSNILMKLRNKNMLCPAGKEKPVNMPEFPKFLNDDRPQIFYPRYLPFEKERFENDVKSKMKALSDEQKTLQNRGKDFPVLT